MKLRNAVLLDNVFIEALRFFSKQHIPIAVSFMLDKCLEIMQKELDHVNKKKEELIKTYGTEVVDKDGNQGFDVSKSSLEKQKFFVAEFNELVSIEFELPIENKLELSLKKLENVEMSTEYLSKLKTLFDFKE